MKLGIPPAVVIALVNIVSHVNNHLIGTGNLDARLGVVETNDAVGIFVLLVRVHILGMRLLIRKYRIIASAVVLVYVPAIRRYLHVGCLSLNNDHSLFLWLILLRAHGHPFISGLGGICVDVVPLLSETGQGQNRQQNR